MVANAKATKAGDCRLLQVTATLSSVSSSQLMFEQLPSQDERLKSLIAAAQRDARDGRVALRIGRRGGRGGQQSQCRIEQIELTLLQSIQKAVAQNLNSDSIATEGKASAGSASQSNGRPKREVTPPFSASHRAACGVQCASHRH